MINRCVVWETLGVELPDGDLAVDGTRNESASIRFVVAKALANCAIGVISPKPLDGIGKASAILDGKQTEAFYVGVSQDLQLFYRFLICFEKVAREEFTNWTHLAFKRLRFALELSTQLNKFRQDYDGIRETIVLHLAAINDDFVSHLIDAIQPAEICDRIRSFRGVDISPESSKTHKNRVAMKEREVEFEEATVICEFHSKLDPTHDRIHFSPTLRGGTENHFLVVGPFAEHLTTK